MSEENKWGTGLPDEDKNASAEQKPLTHPYSEGRRMQESRQDSDAGAGQSEGTSQEKPKYGPKHSRRFFLYLPHLRS